MTKYPGIDYGNGKTNIDPNTVIRFGITNQDNVPGWFDDQEAVYVYMCPDCNKEYQEADLPNFCPDCGLNFEDGTVFEELDPIGFRFNKDGYQMCQSYDDPDIFILKSPYYTYCMFCSPCAPGAGDLSNPFELSENYQKTIEFLKESGNKDLANEVYETIAKQAGFVKTYCLGFTWFEDSNMVPPYPIFTVVNPVGI